MKYCQVSFGNGTPYTYENAGAQVGDEVIVSTARGEKRVKVVGLTDEEPKFATKPIKGLAPKKDPAK